MPLIFEPGTSFMYGPGYDWAGRMVERATGLQLGAYLDQHIFTPLAISTLHFFPSKRPDLQGRLMPEVAHHSPEKPLENGPIFWAAHEVKEDCIGGAGLYGTPADFLKILTALLKNDGTLLKPASVDTLLSGHSSPSAQAEFKRLTTENRDRRAEWSPGLEDTLDWNYGFGGNVLQSEAPGKLSKGSAMWVGVANLVWVSVRSLQPPSARLTSSRSLIAKPDTPPSSPPRCTLWARPGWTSSRATGCSKSERTLPDRSTAHCRRFTLFPCIVPSRCFTAMLVHTVLHHPASAFIVSGHSTNGCLAQQHGGSSTTTKGP